MIAELAINHTSLLLSDIAWQNFNWQMLLVAGFASIACAINGSFLVLKRMSLMGDAISHSVLPGLVMAFVLTGSRSSGVMFVGAVVVGLLTTWLIQVLQNNTRIGADASMGVVFSALFALGIILLKIFVNGKVDIDIDCVLQGDLTHAVNKVTTFSLFGNIYEVPNAAISLGIVMIINIVVVALFWKELQVSAFDEQFAETVGMRPRVIHYILMALTALTTVAAFEAVGSILVIAMLIVPAATAHMLTDRLRTFVFLAVGIGLVAATIGIVLGSWESIFSPHDLFASSESRREPNVFSNMEPSALIAVVGGLLFLLTALFAPRYGAVSVWLERAKQSIRILCEDLLAMFYRLEELVPNRRLGGREAVQAIGGGPLAWIALWTLWYRSKLAKGDYGLLLTEQGRQSAARIVRSHRLWETWLVKYLGLPLDHVHSPAERMEHYIGGEIAKQLSAEVGPDEKDPHGRSIPGSKS